MWVFQLLLAGIVAKMGLTVSTAQGILNNSKKRDKQSWAKQLLVARELERIAYAQNLPKERKQIAVNIINGSFHFPNFPFEYSGFLLI